MTYLDTSVLIAAVLEDEPQHPACLQAVQSGGCTSHHSLLEAFSILTGGRAARKYSPAFAARLIGVSFEKQLKSISLTWQETHAMLAETQARGIRGGAIYDYQHLVCARKAGATAILTLNVKDFLSFAREGDPQVRSPS
ncbi:PIN domain-containing protein [Luteolibacter flavescens]|uniref:PIN domain-containing protein n=1 Tax=Luteolibacter flavescens TaxID=1859460 RepID=A0ABT3FMG3_9BACT|nr:PIN domain-containing protein [Luteolibacter flavescens]MCW1884753.1 PIN domain-containing protein [Luteolibacter flavescens]